MARVRYSGLEKEEYELLVKELDDFFEGKKKKRHLLVQMGFTEKEAHDIISDIAKLKRQQVAMRAVSLKRFKPLVSEDTWASAVVSSMRKNENTYQSDGSIEIESEALEIIFKKQKKDIRKRRRASAMYYMEKANRILLDS